MRIMPAITSTIGVLLALISIFHVFLFIIIAYPILTATLMLDLILIYRKTKHYKVSVNTIICIVGMQIVHFRVIALAVSGIAALVKSI